MCMRSTGSRAGAGGCRTHARTRALFDGPLGGRGRRRLGRDGCCWLRVERGGLKGGRGWRFLGSLSGASVEWE